MHALPLQCPPLATCGTGNLLTIPDSHTTTPVIDIQDFAALALRASYNSAGLAQKKKTLALIENKFTCPGQA